MVNRTLWVRERRLVTQIFLRYLQCFQCMWNEKSVSFRVENIVRKGETAFYKQFLLFSQCFSQLWRCWRTPIPVFIQPINFRAIDLKISESPTKLHTNFPVKDVVLNLPKLMPFVNDICNTAHMICLWDGKPNIVSKGEKAGYPNLSPLLTMFPKYCLSGSVKTTRTFSKDLIIFADRNSHNFLTSYTQARRQKSLRRRC